MGLSTIGVFVQYYQNMTASVSGSVLTVTAVNVTPGGAATLGVNTHIYVPGQGAAYISSNGRGLAGREPTT